ncbi:MAG: S-ribosylhomocysteine lyase [Clostridiales bacterium]|jgi:S-ribosylhomocysteine lyase|nr:S-ribosylhomocysteine lyase [Clostridiales bacterium]HOA33767.1 S-ribosylhomocysteine lyase [Clostridiales bacterium]HOJ35730.1 S-ribosylhomocysteine lyase [Clostridiales bacterium]HOL79145.1 S-ribosylhomocysteine lyase [Clostridiales bacterium]HPU66946.1 S-ribosylhomocysteine lyase [Clostridiales bacterium]
MKRIASFEVNHNILERGMYTSRIDGDAVTYDIRMRRPNKEPVISNAAIHTIEHLFATFVRNSEYAQGIIYFGPMGCRTGFYFIVRDSISPDTAIKLAHDAFKFIAEYEGEIPGATEIECGNFREHSLEEAKKEAADFYPVLENWTAEMLKYKE